MFFRKKQPETETEEKTATSVSGSYKAVHEEMDKNLEQKKQTMSAAQRLARRIGDTFPPQSKKPRTA